MLPGKNRSKIVVAIARGCGLALLLAVYVLGSSNIYVHGFLSHHPLPDQHAAEVENDPCHISLYHQERDGGCEHDTHLVAIEKCAFCHLAFQSLHFFTLPLQADNFVKVTDLHPTDDHFGSSAAERPLSARAPPFA